MKENNNKGLLYIVATPIGNLGDITYRAVEVLKSVDLILAEDTRVSRTLLNHYNIDNKLESYFEHNEEEKITTILEYLDKGLTLALISDAGTPLINDPGFKLVEHLINNNYKVEVIPGPTSVITALLASGINPLPFTFIGFLPRKENEIINMLLKYQYSRETIILFESPHRLKKTLNIIKNHLPDREIAITRELTKMHETVIKINTNDITEDITNYRGEYVIVISGNDIPTSDLAMLTIHEHVKLYVNIGYTINESIKLCAKDREVSKNEIYQVIKGNKERR